MEVGQGPRGCSAKENKYSLYFGHIFSIPVGKYFDNYSAFILES
jgi:hypothetical protein